MDYNTYYCTQAKLNQKGSSLPIQGINQLEPSNLDFVSKRKNLKRKELPKNKKIKRSGSKRKPQNKLKRKLSKKLKRKTKKIKRSKSLDIFV